MAARSRKPKRGGRRPGAGRPVTPGGKVALLQLRLSAGLLARVQLAAEVRGTTVPNYVRGLLDATTLGDAAG